MPAQRRRAKRPASSTPRPRKATASALFAAVGADDAPEIRRLLAAGVPVDARNADGSTPFLVAVSAGSPQAAQALIEAGADVDAFDRGGNTALTFAPSRDKGLAAAILGAPGDALSRARRLIETSSSDFRQPPEVMAAVRAFVDAAARGDDLSGHAPPLRRRCSVACGPQVRNELLKPLLTHALRKGDRAMVEDVMRAAGSSDTFWLRQAFSFATAQGATLEPVYDLVVPLVAAASGQSPHAPLDAELHHHPERLASLAAVLTKRAPRLLPEVLQGLLTDGWTGDFAPAVPFLFEQKDGKRGVLNLAAGHLLEAVVRARGLDVHAVQAQVTRALAGGSAFHAALLLAAAAAAQQPADWRAVDRLCNHERPEARRGALQALAISWERGLHPDELTRRLALGLVDAEAAVRRQVAEALREGQRRGARLGEVDGQALASVVPALHSKERAAALAALLSDYVATSAARARAVLALIPSPAATAEAASMARVCQAVIDGAYVPPCLTCRGLAAQEQWGEFLEDPRVRPEPPEFHRLEAVGVEPANSYATNGYELPYRCPSCGAWFNYDVSGWEFYGNSTFWTCTLERVAAEEGARWSREPWARVHDLVKAGDLAGLARTLLQPDDAAVRVATMKALEKRVEAGLDAAPLEPTLRGFLAGPADLRTAGARLLSRQLLRHGRGREVAALLDGGVPELQRGALDAVWWGATVGGASADVSPCLASVRPFLAHADEGVRGTARAILATAGLRPDEIAATAADAARRLDSDAPGERAQAASLLAEAAKKGADIAAALPGLSALQSDGQAGRDARDAVRTAGLAAPDPKPVVATLVEHLKAHRDELESIHALAALQEKGSDVSPAFEELGRLAAQQSWALEVLKRAVQSGRDIAPAAPALEAAVEASYGTETVGDYPGWAIVEVLSQHYAHAQEYGRLEALLASPRASYVEAAAKGVRWAVLGGRASLEALLVMGRLKKKDAQPASARPPTSWRKDSDNVEVNEREVLAWTDDRHGGIGTSWPLESFLDDAPRLVGLADTFGPDVLAEIVDAVAAQRARRV